MIERVLLVRRLHELEMVNGGGLISGACLADTSDLQGHYGTLITCVNESLVGQKVIVVSKCYKNCDYCGTVTNVYTEKFLGIFPQKYLSLVDDAGKTEELCVDTGYSMSEIHLYYEPYNHNWHL